MKNACIQRVSPVGREGVGVGDLFALPRPDARAVAGVNVSEGVHLLFLKVALHVGLHAISQVRFELPVVDPPFPSVPQGGFLGFGRQQIVILEHVEQVPVGWFQRIVDDAIVEAKEPQGVFCHALGNFGVHVFVNVLLNGTCEFCERHSHLDFPRRVDHVLAALAIVYWSPTHIKCSTEFHGIGALSPAFGV